MNNMKAIYILLGALLVLIVVLIAGVAANIVITLDLQGRLRASQPVHTPSEWNIDEWARKAMALDGHDEIVPDRLSYYTFLMEESSGHCVESKAVLDRLIEAALFDAPKDLANIRMGILSVYAGLPGRHDCSAMLYEVINQLNE